MVFLHLQRNKQAEEVLAKLTDLLSFASPFFKGGLRGFENL